MRIVTLLPSATDIVVSLGAGDELVGVSHSCDPEWRHLPILTSTIVDTSASSAEIDAQVKSAASPLYHLDVDLLEELKPDVVVSQSLCDVCAVSSGDVEVAVRTISSQPQLVNLEPFCLADIPQGIKDVGAAIGRQDAAEDLCATFARMFGDAKPTAPLEGRPRVAFLDWLDPPFAAGHWIPEMIEAAGGISALAQVGQPSHEITWAQVRDAKPDIVLAAICGFPQERAAQDLALVPDDQIKVLDGYKYFSRPSPKLIECFGELKELINKISRSLAV